MRSSPTMLSLALLLALTGCGRSVLDARLAADAGAITTESRVAFWRLLRARRTLTNSEALRGLLLTADEADADQSFEARILCARKRGWISEDDVLLPDESVRFGTIAVATCDLLDIKGGITLRLFGPSERYCSRELAFRGITPRRTELQTVSGLEFLDLIRRIEKQQQGSSSP